jgi:Fe-S-cluster-containing hydrogenase component 2
VPKLIFDPDECTGCLSCVTYCSLRHAGMVSPASARLRLELDSFGGQNAARLCRQCKKAPCAARCPEEAIRFEAGGGYWRIDYDRCTGCRECIAACPFDALFWDPNTQRVIKCETCGGAPLCVEVCPTGALRWRASVGRGGNEAGEGAGDG